MDTSIPTPRTDAIRDLFRGDNTGLCRALIAHANELERRVELLARASRENLISARIIRSENNQRGHIHGIERDAKFIIERTEAVLGK